MPQDQQSYSYKILDVYYLLEALKLSQVFKSEEVLTPILSGLLVLDIVNVVINITPFT